NLYRILSPVSYFIREYGDLSNTNPLDREKIYTDTEKLNVSGIAGRDKLLLWIQNSESNWYNEYSNNEFEAVSGNITIPDTGLNCNAEITIYNPWTKDTIEKYTAMLNKTLNYLFKDLKRDLLILVKCK
ncbi:MAG: hypothetical protein N3B13_02150, partial [Deltaproteobacteria bacterium]|nr:hypothetical protein [Deltaproteobacteria bacterium]